MIQIVINEYIKKMQTLLDTLINMNHYLYIQFTLIIKKEEGINLEYTSQILTVWKQGL